MKKILILPILTLLPFYASAADIPLRTVTVQGQATQDFDPDIADFSVTIIGRAAKREEAKSIHDKQLSNLLDLAKKYNIADKDLSTRFSSINPNYEWLQNGKRKFIDYTDQTTVNITMRDLKKVAQLQDDLVTKGFDDFQGPNYTLDKMYTYTDKVLASAVANAKEKATILANSLGEKIDRPMDIKEENTGYNAPQPRFMAKAMIASPMAASPVAPPAGIINVRSAVVVTFSFK